jgi:hypothetical protein
LVLAQTPSPIKGTVTSDDGSPIPGVSVYGSVSKQCCPYTRDKTTTDEKGEFRLDNPGAVLHFWIEGFQPKTIVLSADDSDVHVTMSTSSGNDFVVPVCGRQQNGQRRIGWGRYGVQFVVGVKARIQGGKPDVDYVRYVLTLPKSKSHLEFWFGPYAISAEPDDDQFENSVGFAERNLAGQDGKLLGAESWGHLKMGGRWRQTAVVAQGGALYRNAQADDAHVFDQIIESVCIVPYPKS